VPTGHLAKAPAAPGGHPEFDGDLAASRACLRSSGSRSSTGTSWTGAARMRHRARGVGRGGHGVHAHQAGEVPGADDGIRHAN
jgi:hypothetical protein